MRTRLFLVSLALIVAGLAAAELLLVPRLERAEVQKVEDLLSRLASAASDSLEVAGTGVDTQATARRLSEKLGVRISFISRTGEVRGDGNVSADLLLLLENHRDRPEVRAALGGERGTASRESKTLGVPFLYVALPAGNTSHGFITRAAIPLAEIDGRVVRMRRSLLLAAFVALLVAGSLSSLAARLVSVPLREMTEVARALAEGRFGGRVDASADDDLGRLGGAINEMSGKLALSLDQLTRERDLLDAVLEGMSEGVLVTDRDDRMMRANRALVSHLGIPGSIGPLALLDATRQPVIVDQVHRVRASGKPVGHQMIVIGAPERAFLVSSTPIAGNLVVTVLLEITELRRLERVRQDFVANVSHELRTPVATLQAAGETLLDSAIDPARANELTAMIARNAERLGNLVTDLLALARLDAGELDLRIVAVDIAGLVSPMLEARAEAAGRKGLRMITEVGAGLSVRADARAFEQVLANLLDNAIRYTPDGGEVGVLVESAGERRRVIVWDTGPGIAPYHRERIFERFYRVDPGRSRELGGTGLGLAIVRHLAEAMAGRVGVEGRKSGGSRFWIELPVGPAVGDPGVV